MQLHEEEKALMAATGASEKYGDVMESAMKTTMGMGIAVKDLGAAMNAMYTDMSHFTTMSAGQQKEMTGTIAKLNKMGVEAGASTKIHEHMTKVMGMGNEEARVGLEETYMAAKQLGMTPGEYMGSMAKLMPKLVMFGRKGPTIFHNLQKKARAAGLAVEDLVGVSDQSER